MTVGANESGHISMDYNASSTGLSGIRIQNNTTNVFEITKSGIINNVQTIIFRGSTFNNVNSGRFLMGTGNATMSNTTSAGNNINDKLFIGFGGSSDDSVIKTRVNNVDRVVMTKNGIDFHAQFSPRLSIDSDTGNIDFKNTIGNINGYSSTVPNAMTNFTMFDQSNQLPHPRFVQICDPVVHSVYVLTAGAWKNMAGYVGNNPSNTRFTNADLSFVAFSPVVRVNVIFSCVITNNMGVRLKQISVNGTPTGVGIGATERLFHGTASHRGQHEYTTYLTGLTIGSVYVIAPEVFVGGGGSNTITMFVGSKTGSATLQNADSPIIVEAVSMNRVSINNGNLYNPADTDSDSDDGGNNGGGNNGGGNV